MSHNSAFNDHLEEGSAGDQRIVTRFPRQDIIPEKAVEINYPKQILLCALIFVMGCASSKPAPDSSAPGKPLLRLATDIRTAETISRWVLSQSQFKILSKTETDPHTVMLIARRENPGDKNGWYLRLVLKNVAAGKTQIEVHAYSPQVSDSESAEFLISQFLSKIKAYGQNWVAP